ncbi:MAG: hypothetical protein PUP91_39070 [Rhizonema sp. PD37]|nr:hypothetical protein [Rhizonema sp. PD37]
MQSTTDINLCAQRIIKFRSTFNGGDILNRPIHTHRLLIQSDLFMASSSRLAIASKQLLNRSLFVCKALYSSIPPALQTVIQIL